MVPLQNAVEFSNTCDGVILASAPCLEGAALQVINSQIPAHAVGVLPPRRVWDAEEKSLAPGPIKAFLDSKSKQSVWLITVGFVMENVRY